MKKIQSFFITKISSSRIKDSNFKIKEISFETLIKNGEIVRLGDSQLLRSIRKIRKIEFSQEMLDELLLEKNKLLKKKNSHEFRKKIRDVSEEINKILFCPDLIIIEFEDIRHYKNLMKHGLFVNGVEYKRIICGAGHARRSSSIFCNIEIWKELNDILECGRNLDVLINPNKYSAYQALASSATHVVSRPNFVVINDYEIERISNVDLFVSKDSETDPFFENKTLSQKINVFDGEGLISVQQAKIWQEDLELDYAPSEFIFRCAYSKGLLVTFDIHSFAESLGIKKIVDIYGVEHWVDDIDVIMTLSQFKMSIGYNSLAEYSSFCKKYEYSWGVTRVSPKKEKDIVFTTYQYLQTMDIKKEEISSVCEKTKNWLSDVSGLDLEKTILFLLGEIGFFEKDDFRFLDVLSKAILLEPRCLKDAHVRKKIIQLINKKIKDSYIGTLIDDGNYQFIVIDTVALAQWAFGLPVKGVVPKGSVYSKYWNEKNVDKISILRSPMTWRSEHVVADICKESIEWFLPNKSGIIFSIEDDYVQRLGGADADGDIIMSTGSFTKYQYPNLNIPIYDRKTSPKKIINHDELWNSDVLSFGSKVGITTNISTTFYSLLPFFEEGSIEKNLILNRLEVCSILQNCAIDSAKGIETYKLPEHWDKWQKNNPNANEYNKILARQRPYFFRYVYKNWNKKYRKHLNAYENLCIVRFGFSLETLLNKEILSDVEQKIKEEFLARSPLINSESTVNLVCHHMEKSVRELKDTVKNPSFNYRIYMNPEIEIDETKLHKMELLLEKFKAYQRNSHDRPQDEIDSDEQIIENKDEFLKVLEHEAYSISNNLSELTNLLVEVCYGRHGENSKEFCWKMFSGQGIIENLKNSCRGFVQVPVLDKDGEIEYLGKRYSLTNVVLD